MACTASWSYLIRARHGRRGGTAKETHLVLPCRRKAREKVLGMRVPVSSDGSGSIIVSATCSTGSRPFSSGVHSAMAYVP
jgi:hypothetical protein